MPVPKKGGKKGGAGTDFQPPPYDPSLPEPTTREDFIQHWLPLTLDDRTAQKLLWISEGGSKVSRSSDAVCPYQNTPERYDHSPQVLCKEVVQGFRAYWEVDFDGWVVLGVLAESSPRKVQDGVCGLGENALSWGVGWSGSCYQVWHNSENTDIPMPLSPRLGIYVDQPAGIIKFLSVESPEGGAMEVRLISKFKASLPERLLPGFWVGCDSYCVLRQKEP